MRRNKFGRFAKSIIIIVCVMTSKGFAVSPWDSPLDINLVRITNQDKGEGTDIQKLEDKCLELLRDHNSPEDKGKIYAKIAFMYSGKGYSSPNDIRISKTLEYCNNALKQPLDSITTAEMYSRLASAQMAYKFNGNEKEFAAARHEAIINALKGLKLVLDNNAPKEWKGPPTGTIYHYFGEPNDPYRKIIQKKMEEQIANRKKWDDEQKLYFLRKSLIDGCANSYAYKSPHDMNELENSARDILKGHNDAIDEIMSKVNERIPKQKNK